MSIKITLTDDHPLVVSGLEMLLRGVPHIQVIGTYASGDELLEGLQQQTPDVILTDLQMPGQYSGSTLIRMLRDNYPEIPVLILSGEETISQIQEMMQLGCKGYLPKNATGPETLTEAIEQVCNGGIFLDTSLRDNLLHSIWQPREQPVQPVSVSRREQEVLGLIAAGLSSQGIAEKLHLSVRTIDFHRLSLLQKFEVKNAVALINKATLAGLL